MWPIINIMKAAKYLTAVMVAGLVATSGAAVETDYNFLAGKINGQGGITLKLSMPGSPPTTVPLTGPAKVINRVKGGGRAVQTKMSGKLTVPGQTQQVPYKLELQIKGTKVKVMKMELLGQSVLPKPVKATAKPGRNKVKIQGSDKIKTTDVTGLGINTTVTVDIKGVIKATSNGLSARFKVGLPDIFPGANVKVKVTFSGKKK